MSDASGLEDLLRRRYNYVVSRDGDAYTVIINELCLIATGEDLGECIATVEREKEELFKTFAVMGRGDYLPRPSPAAVSEARAAPGEPFGLFLGRSAMMAFIIVAGMSVFGLIVANQVRPFFHYTYVRELTTKVAAAIVEDFGRPVGEDWKLAMERLRNAKKKYREVVDILNEEPEVWIPAENESTRSDTRPGERASGPSNSAGR